MDQFNSFERIQSIRDHLLRNTIMRNSIFDYVELVVNFDNEVDLIQGNELNRYLKAITDFQNSLMRELITCQEKDRLSDISFHFENQELNGFANVKFPIIKPIKIVKGNSFSFYISKKAMKYLNDTIMKFEYLNETPKLPESYHFSIMATSLSTSALSIFTLALELHVNNEYTLPTPLRKTIEYYLPPSLADFVKQASKDTTIECINIAKNFNSELLLSFFCANIASMIKGKSTEQIREMFGIVNGMMMQPNNPTTASSSAMVPNGASNQLPPPTEQGYLSQPNMVINYPVPQHNYHSTNSFQTPLIHNNPPTPSKNNTSQGMINPSNGQNMENPTSAPHQQQPQYIQQPMVHNSPGKGGNMAYYSAPGAIVSNNPQYAVQENLQQGYVNPTNQAVEEPKSRPSDEPQLVFSCKHCRTIFIDSNALFFNGEEHGIITFLKVHKVEVRENVQIAPNDRFDAGSNYYPIFCKQCQTLVGRKYLMSDKSPIVDIIGYYTLDIDALSLYELWTAEQETGSGDIQGRGGHIDSIRSIPTNRAIMNEITLLKNALLSLKKNQAEQEGEISHLKKEFKESVENNEYVKKIPELLKKVSNFEKEISTSLEEQRKISHINRRLNNDVVHIKKETGITPLGAEPKPIPQPTEQQPPNKKRTSMGSTTVDPNSSTPETNSKKKKTK